MWSVYSQEHFTIVYANRFFFVGGRGGGAHRVNYRQLENRQLKELTPNI